MTDLTQTIYVVDDDEAMRDSMTWLLEGEGYRVSCFDSAEHFLKERRDDMHGCLVLDVRMPDEALVTEADPSRLKQVLANLLSNAIKYSPDGGCISVEGWKRNGVVGVAVADPGLGIPAAEQPAIEIMRTDTATWRKLVEASRHAIGGWAVRSALHSNICNRTVPTRPVASPASS